MGKRNYSLQDVQSYLKTGKYPQDLPKEKKFAFRKYSKNFIVDGNAMFYDGNTRKKVIFDDGEKSKIFMDCHDSGRGAHMGYNKTQQKICQKFYWVGMTQYIQERIKACDSCQKMSKIKTVSPELTPIRSSEPWEILGIDIIGPFTETTSGNRFCLTVTDLFSKWIECYPLPTKSSTNIATRLYDLFLRFGPPKRIITDQGREFVNSLNQSLLDEFGIKHLITSAYHPQCNGQDERTNQTIKRALTKLTNDEQTDWDINIPAVLFGIRTSQQASTKCAPFVVMFGRQPRFFSQLSACDLEEVTDIPQEPSPEVIRTRQEKIVEMNKLILNNIENAQSKQKKHYAEEKKRGVKSFHFEKGDIVLKRNYRKQSRKGNQMQKEWFGPYIIESLTSKTAHLTTMGGRKLKSGCSLIHLKPYKKHIELPKKTSPVRMDDTHTEDIPENKFCDSHIVDVDTLIDEDTNTQGDNTASEHRDFTQKSAPHTVNTTPTQLDERHDKETHPIESHDTPIENFNNEPWIEITATEFEQPKRIPSAANTVNIPKSALQNNSFIYHGEWLDDTVIDKAQYLLSKQFQLAGFQSCVVLQSATSGGYIKPEDGQFVQIMNVNNNHWILLTKHKSIDDTILVYDSMGINITAHVRKVCASLLHTRNKVMTIMNMDCHQQRGSSDCGLFAIASATCICFNEDPSTYIWNQKQMRQHLEKCFETSTMAMFPFVCRRRRGQAKHSVTVELHCLCRQPDEGEAMVQCGMCKTWYHNECHDIEKDNWLTRSWKFVCKICQSKSIHCRNEKIKI